MGIQEDGIKAEQWLLNALRNNSSTIVCMQPDALAKDKETGWELYEIKNQDIYVPPPFYGHGLPLWQIKTRLQFQNDTGVRAILIVREKTDDNTVYMQYFDVLEKGEYFDTKGDKPRRVYNINSFNKLEL